MDYGFQFSVEKTTGLMIPFKKRIAHMPNVRLLNKRIKFSRELKYLGDR